MNHKSAEEHEMISKACENFSKNKRIINIRDNFFQKICCLSAIEAENDHNLESRLFESLKLSAFIFSFVNQTHWIRCRSIWHISFYIN